MSGEGGQPGSQATGDASSGEGAGNHWKADKRTLNIDYDSLDRLLFEESECNKKELDIFEISAHDHSDPVPPPHRGESRLILHSSSTNSIYHANEFKDLERADKSLREIFSQSPDESWWLDMQNPSEHELRHICAAFNIHPLTIEDIWKQEASEKIEEYPSYRFSSFRSFHEVREDGEIVYEPFTIYIIVFSQGTLSFCFDDNRHSGNVERRITRFDDLISMKSDWIFYAFVDDIVDFFVPSISHIEKEVSLIEEEVYTSRNDDMKEFLWQIESIRRRVLSLIRLLDRKDHVLRGFENHHATSSVVSSSDKDKEILLYINDVQDHITTMLQNLHQFEGLLSRSKTNYLAQLESATITTRIRVFKFLSDMSIFGLVLTLVTVSSTFFGVNVSEDNPLFNNGKVWPWYVIIASEIVVTVSLFYLLKKYQRYW